MTGRITEIRVDTELGWIGVEDQETELVEKRFIWSDVVRQYTAADRLRQSMWVSLLRDALVHNLVVNINEDADNFITSVVLKRA